MKRDIGMDVQIRLHYSDDAENFPYEAFRDTLAEQGLHVDEIRFLR